MSVFDQNLGRTVITANVIKDTIAESRKYPDHTISEDELENAVTTVVESIYYRCKAGDVPSDGKWRFSCRLFGVAYHDASIAATIRATLQISKQNTEFPSESKIQEEHKRIQDYIQKRFHELGYTTTWDDSYNEIIIELPWSIENTGWDSPYNIYSSARDWISKIAPTIPPDINGKMWYMDFPGCDRVDAGDQYQYDTIDAIDNCSGWIRNSN